MSEQIIEPAEQRDQHRPNNNRPQVVSPEYFGRFPV